VKSIIDTVASFPKLGLRCSTHPEDSYASRQKCKTTLAVLTLIIIWCDRRPASDLFYTVCVRLRQALGTNNKRLRLADRDLCTRA
jgi:hypothetical protein